jgi:PAS domain S-box-containing protein
MKREMGKQAGHQKVRTNGPKNSDKLIKSAIEEETLIVCKFLADYTITYANENFCTIIGVTKEKLIGAKLNNFVSNEEMIKIKASTESIKETTQAVQNQIHLITNSGNKTLVELIIIPIKTTKDSVLEFEAVGKEQSRKSVEYKINLLKETLKYSNNSFCITDSNNRIVFANDAFYSLFHYKEDELFLKDISTLFNKDFGELYKTFWNGEFINKKKDGFLFSVFLNVTPIRDENGNTYAFVNFVRDLTNQKHLEELFRESEDRFRNLYENSPIGIYRTSPDGKILLANSKIVEMLGYSSYDELANINVKQSGYAGDYTRDDFIFLLEKNGEITGYETTWHKKNNEIVHVRENAKAIKDSTGKILYYDGTVEDINDRKKVELALNHRLEQLQFLNSLSDKVNTFIDLESIYDEAINGILDHRFADKTSLHLYDDKECKFLFYNTGAFSDNFVLFSNNYELWQNNKNSPESIRIADINTDPLTKDYNKLFVSESIRALTIIPMITKSKLIGKFVLYFNKQHEFSTDDLTLVETIANQIAFTIERTKNEETIQNNERRFRALLDRSSDIISIISPEGKVLFDTSSSYKILGQELVGKNIFSLIHPDDLNRLQNDFLELIKDKDAVKAATFRMKHSDGSWRCTESIARNFINDPTINGVVVNTRDITERMNFEKELHESESRYKGIFHNNHAVMIIVDPSTGNIVDANNSACDFYGYNKDTITSLKISDINVMGPNEINNEMQKVVDRSQHFFNFKHKLADGCIRDVEVYSGPVEFQRKKYLYSIIHDQTEKKLAEKTLADERQLFIAGPVVVFKWSATPRAVAEYVSPNVVEVLGYTPEEFMSDSVNFKDIIHPDDFQRGRDEIKAHLAANDLHYHQQYRAKKKNGEYIWLDDFTHIIKNNENKITYYHGYLMDITANKLAEEVILKSEQKLRELNLMKDKFFSVIAHDLRSPFQGLLGMANILVEDDEITEDERIIFQQKLYEGLRTQFNFIEDLLAWSRIQRGAIEFNPEPNNLTSLIEDTITFLQNNADKKNLIIHTEVPGNIVTTFDKNMIATVLRNLISNAIKFTGHAGNIYVSVADQQESVLITIKDTGVGIDENDLKKLFRLDTHFSTRGTEGEGGTGFGLILCKDFVERHNGKIIVDSAQGKGSIFSFSIPKI